MVSKSGSCLQKLLQMPINHRFGLNHSFGGKNSNKKAKKFRTKKKPFCWNF